MRGGGCAAAGLYLNIVISNGWLDRSRISSKRPTVKAWVHVAERQARAGGQQALSLCARGKLPRISTVVWLYIRTWIFTFWVSITFQAHHNTCTSMPPMDNNEIFFISNRNIYLCTEYSKKSIKPQSLGGDLALGKAAAACSPYCSVCLPTRIPSRSDSDSPSQPAAAWCVVS
jgi:hypothetical protein